MINSNELFQVTNKSVVCDDISKSLPTRYGITNLSDLPDRVILYVDPESDRLMSDDSLRAALQDSEWSWLVRDVFIGDHKIGSLHPIYGINVEGKTATLTFSAEDVEEIYS